MTIKDFFNAVGGSYEEALGRLMDEKRILKYLKKFTQTADYENMLNAIAAEDWELAFRSSHNLKGMALNLSLGKLAVSSSALCETMRHGKPTEDISGLMKEVAADYVRTLDMIGQVEG